MDDLETLVRRFRLCTLTVDEWTHVAHLRVAAWHVHELGEEQALICLRSGIRQLNERLGGVNSDTRGYHETITRAYVWLIAAFLRACPPELPLAERVERLTSSALAERALLETFWSRDVLFSARARREWMEPDQRPLTLPANAPPG